MFKLLVPAALTALIGFSQPIPAFAASNDTDISAAKFSFGARRSIGVRSVRVNRSFAVRSYGHRSFRGYHGVRSARFIRPARIGYSSRYVGRYRYGALPTIALAGSRYGVYRAPRSIYWGGRYRSYLPLAALGAVAVALMAAR